MLKKNLLLITISIISSFIWGLSYSSPLSRVETIEGNGINKEFQLKASPIIANTLTITSLGDTLIIDKDYSVQTNNGIVYFLTAPNGTLYVSYSVVPKSITESFVYFKKIVLSDSLSIKNVKPKRQLFNSNSKLLITGSKTFSISVTRDQGVDLDQSLFLKISGELSNNINIEAQLSDSESPISPEGNSKELSSLDEIYIRLYGKQYELAFGDLESEYSDTKFINYSTKFEGLKASYQTSFNAGGALAVTKAKNAENSFNCLDGKQGPYYLSIADNPYNLLIVPGTEVVYINGVEASRGSDYVIDYSDGSITFIKIVNSNTSIRVTFQYSNEKYNQNLYLANAGINLFENLRFDTYLISRSDNRNQPIDTDFTDDELDALKDSGDAAIYVNGVLGPFDSGLGQYVLSDSGDYYVHSDTLGVYDISFTYFGLGQGDYSEISPSVYEYRGTGEGEWLPLKQLYAPELKNNIDFSLKYGSDWFKVTSEAIYTHYDKNTFSSKDDSDNDSWSGFGKLLVKPNWDKVSPYLSFSATLLGKDRDLFADIKDAGDSYSLIYLPPSDTVSVKEYDLSAGTSISDKFKFDLKLKHNDSKDLFTQNYAKLSTSISQISDYNPSINYSLLLTQEEYEDYIYSESDTERHELLLSYVYRYLNLTGAYANYSSKQNPLVVNETGTRYVSYTSGLGTQDLKHYQGNASYRIEQNDTLSVSNDWDRSKDTYTISTQHSLNYQDYHFNLFYNHSQVNDKVDDNKQNVDLVKLSSITGFLDNTMNLNCNYEVNNLEFYPQVRSLVYVGEEEGIYDENGEFEEELLYDYEYINSGDSELSIELNADTSLFIDFKSLFKEGLLSGIQSESYAQVTENSRSDKRWDVYLLRPSTTFNDSTSIYSNRLLRQTFWLDLIPKKCFSVLSYESNETLDNRYLSEFDNATETMETIYDSSIRLNDLLTLDWDFGYRRTDGKDSKYSSDVSQNNISLDIEKKLSTKLILRNQLSYQLEEGSKQSGDDDYEITSLSVSPSATWYYKRFKINSSFDFTSNTRTGSSFLTNYSGKRDGVITNWALKVFYKFNKYTSANLDYTGNSYPDDPTEHKLTLEIKAEF